MRRTITPGRRKHTVPHKDFFKKNEQKAAARQKDLSGMRFGKLTVLFATDKRADGGSRYMFFRAASAAGVTSYILIGFTDSFDTFLPEYSRRE